MKIITLRYSDTKLATLEYDNLAINQNSFEGVKLTTPIRNTTEDSGVLLNGRKYSNLKWVNIEQELVISSDEIDNNILEFLQNFWTSRFKYISLLEGFGVWSNYIRVVTEGGPFPLTNINDLKELPEVALKLSYSEPI